MKSGRNKKDRKKIMATILVVIIVLALLLGLAAPFFASEQNNISINAKIGFEQKYRIGGNTPFSILLKNDGENFNGELQIKIFQYEYGNNTNYSIHSKNIELPKNSVKTINFNIVMPSLQKSVEISLVSNGNIIAKKDEMCKPYSPNDTIIGVLTEDNTTINLLKNLNIRNNDILTDSNNYDKPFPVAESSQTENTKKTIMNDAIVFIDENSFPTNMDILNNFNAIIVNNYDTNRLNSEQLTTLEQWIDNGGNVIIGTGINIDKVFKGLSNIADIYNNSDKILIDDLYGQYYNIILKGSGKILIHSFDLGLSPIENNEKSISLLTNLYVDFVPQTLVSNTSINHLRYDYILNHVSIDNNNISMNLIFVLILLYIIIIGPLLYIILKKKYKLEKGLIIIPIMALCTTFIISILGLFTPYKKSILNAISFIEFKNNNNASNINTKLGILSPNNGNIKLEFDNDVNITSSPNSKNNYYGYNSYSTGDNNSTENIKYKMEMNDKPQVTFYKSQNWDLNILNIKDRKTFDGNIDISMNFENSIPKAKIINNTGYKLENGIIVLGNMYAYFNTIDNNSTIEADFKYMPKESLWLKDIFINNREFPESENEKLAKRHNILLNELNENDNNYTLEDLYIENKILKYNFYAFNSDSIVNTSAIVNGKRSRELNENLFLVEDVVDLSNNKSFILPSGIIKVCDISSELILNRYEDSIMANLPGDIDVTFRIPDNIKINEFKIDYDKPSKIYNALSQQWEDISNYRYTQSIENYIDQNNNIKIRVAVEPDIEIALPNISVNGGN